MVKQYPHKIKLTVVANSAQDNEGDWEPGDPSTKELDCREEPSNGNGLITASDGSQLKFKSIVYMPPTIDPIETGTKVEVYEGGVLRISSTVLRFSKGQLNSRLWLG